MVKLHRLVSPFLAPVALPIYLSFLLEGMPSLLVSVNIGQELAFCKMFSLSCPDLTPLPLLSSWFSILSMALATYALRIQQSYVLGRQGQK